jgi:hypothetical protein
MPDFTNQISEHMTVIGSDGLHVGTVDHMQDGRIKLSKNDDPDGGHHHHFLGLDLVASVEGDMVKLNLPAQAARGMAMRDEA